MAPQHTVPVLKVDMLAPRCDRCGKNFKAKRKNCHNCGVQVCEDCSSYKARLPQFGYTKPVRCCGYCSHFLYVYKMDDAALAKLNIKTLKRYLASYNISTHGMLEKQELIKAIQENRPLPEEAEVYFRKNTPDTVEKSAKIQEEIYATSSHLPQGSGDGRFWDLDKFFAKLFGNDDSPPRPPQRLESTSSSTQKPQTAPRPQSFRSQPQPQPQPQPQSQPQSHPQPAKQDSFNFPQQPQPQPYQQQQYAYPPMPTPQPGAIPQQAIPTPNTHPYAPPTGAAPTFFPAGSHPPAQGYYSYPPGTVPEQGGYPTFNGHTQYQQHAFPQGGQANYQSTNAQYHQNHQTYYQQAYQQYPPQQGQQHPFTHFQQGTPYHKKQSQPQPQPQPQPQSQYQQYQPQYSQQQQHYTQQPQPAPYPASSTSSSSNANTTYGFSASQGSQSKPQATPSPKPTPSPKSTPQASPQPQPAPQASPRPTHTPQAAPRPAPTPEAIPRPAPTPQATPQATRPTNTSRPASSSTAQETSRPQTTPRPAASSTPPQPKPVPPTPATPPRGPRAPQDRNDYYSSGSESGSTPYSSSSHSHQGSTFASDGRPVPQSETTPLSTSSRPPRQSNRGPQTEHSTSLLTVEEIVSENVDPSTLSVKVIKSLLDTNFVSYVGVVEKSDLVGQLQKLMISTRAEQARIFNEQEAAKVQQQQQEQQKQQQQKPSSTGSASNGGEQPSTTDDEHLCKICYEASLNCVMLNCGHMSTCMDCGKKIMEGPRVCPICREYVLKLLHVFRA